MDTTLLVSPRVLEDWHRIKDREGPTFSGSPAWRAHVEFVEAELAARGVRDLARHAYTYPRWWTADDPAAGQWSLEVGGQPVTVAGYWAYSGSTPSEGVTAPLAQYDSRAPTGSYAGKVLVLEVPRLPEPAPAMFAPAGHLWASPDMSGVDRRLTTDHWYQVNYATRFGRFGDILRRSGAVGGVVIFDMGPERAQGLYTFPLLETGEVGVPALYLDREAGARVRSAAAAGETATLRLIAERGETEAWFLAGILPGRHHGTAADEFVLLITHTDGPNLTQENGALGILALVDYFARQPVANRRRSLLILLDPQHYAPGRHTIDWYGAHPELTSRIVASVGVEQLGQREYAERGGRFLSTGSPEVSILFARDDPRLVDWAVAALERHGLPRAELRVPSRPGQGRWFGLGEVAVTRDWPGYALNTEMSAYWSTVPGIESFDAALAFRQLAVLAELTGALLTVPAIVP